MKYVLMFIEDHGQSGNLSGKPPADVYQEIGRWWGEQAAAGRVVSGEELQGPDTATTVRFRGGQPMLSDGPYLETKEVLGGFAVVEVPDLDAALEMAKTWPGQGIVEVRPLVDHSGEQH